MSGSSEGRREERLYSFDSAIMVLADGVKVMGHIRNMSWNGMLFIAEGEAVPEVERGAEVEIVITLYGRDSQFFCTLAHQQGNQFGLQLRRAFD
ncbi:MAG: PilZ domain-containing protein [Magnetococcales bacterium]|nr:PilZ domain-containing protein [Magnetococcales bacterium]